MPLAVLVTAANINERTGARELFSQLSTPLPRLQRIWADSGYDGDEFDTWVEELLHCLFEIVVTPPKPASSLDALPKKRGRPTQAERQEREHMKAQCTPQQLHPSTTYQVPAHRWVVERTFGWLVRSRRLARDYEGLPRSSEAMIQLALSRLMLKRLAAP